VRGDDSLTKLKRRKLDRRSQNKKPGGKGTVGKRRKGESTAERDQGLRPFARVGIYLLSEKQGVWAYKEHLGRITHRCTKKGSCGLQEKEKRLATGERKRFTKPVNLLKAPGLLIVKDPGNGVER